MGARRVEQGDEERLSDAVATTGVVDGDGELRDVVGDIAVAVVGCGEHAIPGGADGGPVGFGDDAVVAGALANLRGTG